MTFQIESGIAHVSNRGGRGRKPTAFPFADMDVGDSFLIPCAKERKVVDSWRRKLLVAKKRFNEQYDGETPWTFSTSSVADGLRVWRTA